MSPDPLRSNRRARHAGPPVLDAVLLWRRIARVYHGIIDELETALAEHGLTGMEFDALVHVGRREGITQQRLARRLLVTKGNVSYQVGKLEERGLIERRPAGRCNHLHLTPTGRTVLDRATPQKNALHVERFGALDHNERQHLLRLLRRLDGAKRTSERTQA